MALSFKNTFSGVKEEFKPITKGKVNLYTCGPTVYNFAHIGNFRTYMFEDLLRRYLKYKGYEVTQVMNLTDIDDKTIKNSQEQGISLKDYTAPFIESFFEDVDTLGIERAEHYPAATDHIPEMIKMIQTLVEKGHAYEIDGDFYFKISSFKEYGQLAGLDLDGLKAGARISADEYEKDSVSDFALWKSWDEKDGDVFWETEIGKGRPGWHIECSAMSTKYLGNHFDIHTGGVDNLFPHHENELAQSYCSTGEKFVNYWLHSEHLIVDNKKMSKSLGNYYTLRDLLEKSYTGVVVRYLLLSTHYRQQMNFTFEGLDAARNALERYTDFISNLKSYEGGKSDNSANEYIEKARMGFESCLDDDLNISGALGVVFDFIRDINRLKAENTLSSDEKDKALETIMKFDTVLNFSYQIKEDDQLEPELAEMIEQRTEAKKNKDFTTADRLRDELLERGIILEDSAQGVRWKRKG